MQIRQVLLRISVIGLLACLVVAQSQPRGFSQDPSLEPRSGTLKLKAGFTPDPVVNVDAGGKFKTNKGDVEAWISERPDVRVLYEAGKSPLTFYVVAEDKADAKVDTTLLVRTPDGKWLANDDTVPGKELNPFITIKTPQSGTYDIWVGTFEPFENVGTPPAKFFVTEKKK